MTDSNLFSEVKTSIDTLGANGVVEVLQKARLEKFSNEVCVFVTNSVTETIGINIQELEKNNSRSDKRKVAIGFCAYLLNKEFNYSHQKISKSLPFGLSGKSMEWHINIIESATLKNPKSDIDKLISSNYFKLQELIINYKNTNQNGTK